ncbi:hypothetical protein [Duganella hordei]|uniref:hypothetical protein n=1 Tax=Duganella hordei TaxID=2865934 RepID=UPI003340E5C6
MAPDIFSSNSAANNPTTKIKAIEITSLLSRLDIQTFRLWKKLGMRVLAWTKLARRAGNGQAGVWGIYCGGREERGGNGEWGEHDVFVITVQ